VATDTGHRATFAPGHEDIPALAERIVQAAGIALVPHTPGDDHTEPASRVASVAVLRVLVADTRSRMTPGKRAHLAALIAHIEHDSPAATP